ncbi:MAG: class I SAM-dependent methyltransferase [Planctomycetaceae bacterium]|nr:class I SAM-dependent methyltransferase [Planctomycetaceae bacterium]
MLSRTLEPEVMDTQHEAVDYDSMDHTAVNQSFSQEFLSALSRQPLSGKQASVPSVLDVGTGTARIPIAIGRQTDTVRIIAVDLSAPMLQVAQRNVIAAGLQRLIKLEQVDAKGLPYTDGQFDAVISNSIVHHIPQPIHVLREMLRVLRAGGLLFVRDLLRPTDAASVDTIVEQHAEGANAHQRQLFEQSLHAALTLGEVRDLLRELGWPPESVSQSSDRHWTISVLKP